MKQGIGFLFILLLSAGCARYETAPLCGFPMEKISESHGVSIAARAFSKNDCRRYLDRNVLRKGYQPVQIYIENMSDTAYLFSPSRLTIAVAPPDEVSKKVHSSTVGRVASYGSAALLASPLFAVPALVDGFKSIQTNKSLDEDFFNKAAHDCVIKSHSQVMMLLFIPRDAYEETFTVTLIDENTHKPLKIVTSTQY